MDKNLCLGTIPFLLLAVAPLLFVICSIATFVALAVPLDHYGRVSLESTVQSKPVSTGKKETEEIGVTGLQKTVDSSLDRNALGNIRRRS